MTVIKNFKQIFLWISQQGILIGTGIKQESYIRMRIQTQDQFVSAKFINVITQKLEANYVSILR